MTSARLAFGERARSCRRRACRPSPAPRAPRRCGSARRPSAPRPVPTMIDIGVARPSAHGHAMISTATALTSACARRGSGPKSAHDDERDDARRRSRPARTSRTRCRPAAGSARAIAAPRRPCATICASSVSLPTRSARITKLPVPLTVPPVTRSPGRFLDRHRLAGDHRLVDGARALEHDAVDRHLLAGPHAQPIADAARASSGTSSSVPSASIRRAVFGARPSSARIAALVRLRARSSSTWPSSTSTTMTAAGLEVDGRPRRASRNESREEPGRERRDDAVARTRRRRRARSA